jgi:hypothetical protein
MGPFKTRLRKGAKWLLLVAAAFWPYVWAFIDTLRNTPPEPKTDEQQRAPQQSRISVEPYGGKDA